jgi:hypothetical protein
MDLFSNPLRNQLHHLHHFWQKTGCKHPHFCNKAALLADKEGLRLIEYFETSQKWVEKVELFP